MFVRVKKSGKYQYLQVVHNQRVEGKVRQQVLGTLGRLDVLQKTGQLDGVIASLSRYAREVAVLDANGSPSGVREAVVGVGGAEGGQTTCGK